MDTSKYQTAFGPTGTPLTNAIVATLAWYRTRLPAGVPHSEGSPGPGEIEGIVELRPALRS
jgi:hypothetical protein